MMNTIIKAGTENWVWIIVGIFWVIAQIAGASKKKKQPLRPVSDEVDDASEEPLAHLMRKLAGVPVEFSEPSPVDATPPSRFPDLRNSIDATPPSHRQQTPAPISQESEPVVEPMEAPAVNLRPTMSAFRNTLPTLKLPAIKLNIQGPEKTSSHLPSLSNLIKPGDQRALRRTMLSHIVFSPPKALERSGTELI